MKPTALAAAAAAATCPGSSSSSSYYQTYISTLAKSIQEHVRVLLPMQGSGNHGESGLSAFYTIDQLPEPLSLSVQTEEPPPLQNKLQRTDLELGPNRLAFYIDHVLTNSEADALAACAEAVLEVNGHSRVAPGIQTPPGMRINEAAHWYPPSHNNSTFLSTVYQRIQPLVPQSLTDDNNNNGNHQLMPLHPRLSEKIAQFKYSQGDEFRRHVDGLFPGQGINPQGNGIDEWTGVVSGLSMLLFLNDYPTDGLEGGATRLWNAHGTQSIDVEPQKGRALFFRRGSSTSAVMHAGLPVTSGDVPKYMALINVAYGEQTGTQPMTSSR